MIKRNVIYIIGFISCVILFLIYTKINTSTSNKLISTYALVNTDSFLPKYTQFERENHVKGQQIMKNIFQEFDTICRTNNLKYWCVGGTLLGAVRHKGWIPHDGDIDVAMLKEDYIKLQNIIQSGLPDDMWFQDKTTDNYYKSEIGKIRYLYAHYDDYKDKRWHNGIQLDIFIYTPHDNILIPSFRNDENKPREYNSIFPLREIYFEDILVYAPNQLEKYMIDSWGGYPPPELPQNKQYPHEGRISFIIPQWMKLKYPYLYPSV